MGRNIELQRIVQALREEKAHVVLYSERGRGKTSLSNLIVQSLRHSGVIVARHTCEAESSFDSIMRGLMRDVPQALLVKQPEGDREEGCEGALTAGDIRPRDVVSLLTHLTCPVLVCVVDEFDRVADVTTRARLADTIKQLSDRAIPLSFLVVGVSDNLDQILGQHPSIQRNLVAVHLPLLTDAEIGRILLDGGAQAGFHFSAACVACVTALARGNPYMVQLLGLRLVQAATWHGAHAVGDEDVVSAIAQMVLEAAPHDAAAYDELTAGGRDAEMVDLLVHLAMAEQDRWGRLRAVPEPAGEVAIDGWKVSDRMWRRIAASGVLRAIGSCSGQYVFETRSFMHHLLLLAEQRRATCAARPAHDETLIAAERAVSGGTTRFHRLAWRA